MSKRSRIDPKYVDRSRISAKRIGFMRTAITRWLQKNRPDVFKAILAEADKRWPLERRQVQPTHYDYSFVERLKP